MKKIYKLKFSFRTDSGGMIFTDAFSDVKKMIGKDKTVRFSKSVLMHGSYVPYIKAVKTVAELVKLGY